MKKLLTLALTACLIACMIPSMAFAGTVTAAGAGAETEPNDVKSQADVVEPSGSITGSLAQGEDVDYYQVKALAGGYVTVDFDLPYSGNTYDVAIFVGDKSEAVWRAGDVNTNVISAKIPVKQGQNVYAKVNRHNYWNDPAGTYTVKFDQMGNTLWETEGNDKKSGAKKMTSGNYYYGNLYLTGEDFMDWQNCKDADYWKYTMPNDGRMKFYFKPASIDYEADEIGAGWKIGVYTSSGADPIYETTAKGNTLVSPNFGFKKGRNLYIKVTPENDFYSHCPDYLDYKLKPVSYASSYWENESNNTRSYAKKMTLGKEYYGSIANTVALPADVSWDRDYFKVTATKTGKMKIYFGNKSSEYDVKDGWKLQIRTSSKVLKTTDLITKTYSSKKSVATVNVKKGQTIYVRVSCGENYWWAPAPANVDYKLKVRY